MARKYPIPLAVGALILSASTVLAFPQDGQFFQGLSCPADGFSPGEERAATLSFPTLCVNGTCCDLSNPVNVRAMEQIFLYDGACTRAETEFDARLLVGEASIDGLIVVLDNLAHTYARCEP